MECYHASVTSGGSALIRGRSCSSSSVRLSCLGCLSSLALFVCSPFKLPLHYFSAFSAVQCPSWYIDVATVFLRVPVRKFAAWVIARQRAPVDTPTTQALIVWIPSYLPRPAKKESLRLY